jgi:hypothetical protein
MSAQFREVRSLVDTLYNFFLFKVVQQMLNTKKRNLLLLIHSPYWKLNNTKNSKIDIKSDSTLINEKCAVVQDTSSSTTVLLWRERQSKLATKTPKNVNKIEILTNGSTTPMLLEPNKPLNGQIFKENEKQKCFNNNNDLNYSVLNNVLDEEKYVNNENENEI